MSQIPSFYLIRNVQKKELSDGGCSGGVYTAIWDWCEDELDMDVRSRAPQTEDALDCVAGWSTGSRAAGGTATAESP